MMTGAALRGLALLGALGGTAGQIFPPPPPGYCQDTVDNPFSPNFRQLSKCCESGDTVEKHQRLIYMRGCAEDAVADDHRGARAGSRHFE